MLFKRRYLVFSLMLLIPMCTARLMLYATLKKIDTCIVHVDPSLSSCCTDFLSARVQELSAEHPSLIFAQLEKEYPCIATISCRYNAYHQMIVTIKAARPILLLNKEYAVLEEARRVAAKWYTDSVYEHVAHVTAAPTVSVESLIAFYAELPESVYTRFKGDWQTDYDIRLYDSRHKESVLIASIDAVPTEHTVAAYDRIISDIKKYSVDGEEKNEKWIADVRFKSQLIFSTQKKGVMS